MTSRDGRRALSLLAGVTLLGAASFGALGEVRRLDQSERLTSPGPMAPSMWRARADGQHGIAFGSLGALPRRAAVRVRACPSGATEPELHLELVASETGRLIAREHLTRNEGRSRRCLDAEWRGEASRSITASLVSKGAPPSLSSLDLRSGGTIRPVDLWPSLAVLLGLALIVFAPLWSRGSGDEPAEALPPPETLPMAARGGWGIALAVGALISANVLAQLPVMRGGVRGVTLLASLGLQQTLLALAAAALMGAFLAPSMRVALELSAPPRGWALRAIAAAVGLLGVATSVGLLLKDAGDSPIARAVESMPVRYVIAFGAVCAPLPEELFFRGLLGRLIASSVGARRAAPIIGLSALVFTLMHAAQLQSAWLGLVPIAALGVVNGWLRWSQRGLAVPWLVHSLYNGALALSALA